MRFTMAFFVSAVVALLVSAYGVIDAYLTREALDSSERAKDANARLMANGGIRTAALRTAQMAGMVHGAVIAASLTPRAVVAHALEELWLVFAVACWISAAKELLAMRDRRQIVPEVEP